MLKTIFYSGFGSVVLSMLQPISLQVPIFTRRECRAGFSIDKVVSELFFFYLLSNMFLLCLICIVPGIVRLYQFSLIVGKICL